ncbi:hypothetical protein DDI_2067 [Dickeya dianthicola RNS04.9]|nr:hypothetical protein DDI_2067 [Dickeya dianthicola RNS04.9]
MGPVVIDINAVILITGLKHTVVGLAGLSYSLSFSFSEPFILQNHAFGNNKPGQ